MSYGVFLDSFRILYTQVPDCLYDRNLTPFDRAPDNARVRNLLFLRNVFYLLNF